MVAIEFNGQGNQWHALLKNCLNLSLALQPTPEVCFFSQKKVQQDYYVEISPAKLPMLYYVLL